MVKAQSLWMYKKINNPGTNIMTAEDPVEFYLKGVGQIQANNEIG